MDCILVLWLNNILEGWSIGEVDYMRSGAMEILSNGVLERWSNGDGRLESLSVIDPKAIIMIDRRNINRGYKKLTVWNDSIQLYQMTWKILKNSPFELKKTAANSIDAAQSISRNIAEGYCRRSIKEYLKHLYIALGSSGELHTCIYSMQKAEQISELEYEELDALHYKTENELIQLVRSLEKKEQNSEWIDKMPTSD